MKNNWNAMDLISSLKNGGFNVTMFQDSEVHRVKFCVAIVFEDLHDVFMLGHHFANENVRVMVRFYNNIAYFPDFHVDSAVYDRIINDTN